MRQALAPDRRTARPGWLGGTPARYLLATIGPVGSSATQFVLSLVMLRTLAPGAFGSFSFLLVVSQLSWGAWSALFCAPLPVFLSSGRAGEQAQGEKTMLAASLMGAMLAAPAFAATAALLGLDAAAVACFAGYGSLALVRWFARGFAYLHGRQLRAMASDIVYSVGVLATLAVGLLVLRWSAQTACYAALLTGAALGLMPFGSDYARRQLAAFGRGDLLRYRPIWRDQSRWALLGVVTTEATANAHVYLITLLQGPRAFAPIAASALLMRPVGVAQNALADFEKPRMARLIGRRDWHGLLAARRMFLAALAAIWLLSAVAAWALFRFDPHLVFSRSYDMRFLEAAAALWLLVAGLRLAQVPPSTVLGAAGEFRDLALASVWSSVASLILTAVLIATLGTLWSIGGVAAGAVLFLFWTERFARSWLADAAAVNGARGGGE